MEQIKLTKFFFAPVERRLRVEALDKPAVTIGRTGSFQLNKAAQYEYFPIGSYVVAYLDDQNRAVAVKAGGKADKEKLKQFRKVDAGGGVSAQSICKALGVFGHYIPNLVLGKYKDDTYGSVVYFIVPDVGGNKIDDEDKGAEDTTHE